MNRLFRRNRRNKKTKSLINRLFAEKPLRQTRLFAEELESRLLLTSLILPRGATGETIFDYADPEESGTYNQIRIGTLSGLPPEKDIKVEVLSYDGRDIPGTLQIGTESGGQGDPIDIGGGPGGISVIAPVGITGTLRERINALATDSDGHTYGITRQGVIVSIDTFTGEVASQLGIVQDAINFYDKVYTYTTFEAASFDPVSGELYAVVTGPSDVDGAGNIISTGQVLISINLQQPVNESDPLFGEAEPVGRDIFGLPSYHLSRVGVTAAITINDGLLLPESRITTIAYGEITIDGGDLVTQVLQDGSTFEYWNGDHNRIFNNIANEAMGTRPVFVGFEVLTDPTPDGEDIPNRFISISVVPNPAGNGISVQTQPVYANWLDAGLDPEVVIEGLMYGKDQEGQIRLFGLNGGDENKLMLVTSLQSEQDWVEIVEYPENVVLTGMSYDTEGDVGYATDPVSRTLYKITTTALAANPEGDGYVINGGLADVYLMYIAQSTADTYITFTRWTPSESGPDYSPTGGTPAYLITDEDDSDITTPSDAGGVMIGTSPYYLSDSTEATWSPHDTFIDSGTEGAYTAAKGYWPGGVLRPGIIVAGDQNNPLQPQDIGRIQVGGGVFGDVRIHGSIDMFYAGYLGTNRFIVDGDLNNLVVATQAGGIEESDGSWYQADDAIVDVRGRMGSFYSIGDWGLPIRVRADATAPTFPGLVDPSVSDLDTKVYVRSFREIERNVNWPDPDGSTFPSGTLEKDGGYIINNDSFGAAQYLGTVDGIIKVIGEAEWPDYDAADYYSFGVMAGQTITIQLYDLYAWSNYITGHPYEPGAIMPWDSYISTVELYDPNQVVVGRMGEVEIDTGAPMSLVFTAEEAGIYTIDIDPSLYSFLYRLEISGVSETTLGGGNIGGDLRTGWQYSDEQTNVQVMKGNVGAISVEGIFRGGRVVVQNGSLAGLRAGNGGTPVGFNWEILDGGAPGDIHPSVFAGGDIGLVSSPVDSAINIKAGGDLQSLRMGQRYAGTIIANDNIGEIRIEGDYGPQIPFEDGSYWSWYDLYYGIRPGIWANADGVGEPGIIDSIYVGGNFGLTTTSEGEDEVTGFEWEIPVSAGGRGGNVRFVEIGGQVYNRIGLWFSGIGFGPFVFDPGQSVEITDDSGVLVRLAPGFEGDLAANEAYILAQAGQADEGDETDDTQQQPDEGEQVDLGTVGGILTLKLLPIRDGLPEDYVPDLSDIGETLLGYAIAGIDSTDGLRVSTKGGSVELGVVTVVGNMDASVVYQGSNPITVLRTQLSGTINSIFNNTQGDLVTVVIDAGTGNVPDEGTDQTPADQTDQIPQPDQAPVVIDYPFDLIKVKGHLGWTPSNTGQRIVSSIIVGGVITGYDPVGEQRSGLLSAVAIDQITVGGSLGDVNVTGGVQRIIINSDRSSYAGIFEGVAGAVLINGDLDYIELGDGIRHPGRGELPLSGLFVTGDLNRVSITGPGHDIAGPILVTGDISRVQVRSGARIVGYNGYAYEGDRIRGVAVMGPSIATTADFHDFIDTSTITTGSINTIEVKGKGSEIYGANIRAFNVNQIIVGGGARGMFYSRINCYLANQANYGVINTITVGGEGIYDSIIVAGRYLGSVKVSGGGTISYSEIRGSLGIGSITADEINNTDISAYNKLDKVIVKGGIYDLEIETGELGQLKAKSNILGSAIYVGGPLGSIYTKGNLITTLEVTGPYGNLCSVKVGGDLGTPTGGQIIVDGKIGSIQVGGDFLAGLQLNWDPVLKRVQYVREGIELGKLIAKGRIIGIGDIGGDVGSIQSGDDFGKYGSNLHVHGDMKAFSIGSGKNLSDLQSHLIVDGDLGTVTVYGSINGNINVTGDFQYLNLRGANAYRANLNGNVVVGGNFKKMAINNGDEFGNIIVGGTGPKKTIKGSDILGTTIVDGGEGFVIEGSLIGKYISTGDIKRIELGGDISESGVLVIQGDLDELIVNGSIEGLVHVTGNIGTIRAANMGLEDALGIKATITAGGNIGSIDITGTADSPGTVKDSFILAGFDPGFNGLINVAEFDPDDPGAYDPTRLTVDGTAVDGREQALTGSIDKVNVGVLDNSVIAAGVGPGENNVFGDTDGSDIPGGGQSIVNKVIIGSVIGDGSPFGVFADTKISQLRVGGVKLQVPIFNINGFRSWIVQEPGRPGIGGQLFAKGEPFKGTIVDGQNEIFVSVIMSGPGTGELVLEGNQIGEILLRGTTEKTSIKVIAAGKATIDVGKLTTGDDEGLKALIIDGRLANSGNDAFLSIDGGVSEIILAGIGPGSELIINGPAKSVDLGNVSGTASYPSTINIAGDVQKLSLDQASYYTTIAAGSVGNMTSQGQMNGNLIFEGNLITAKVLGDMRGVISAAGNIDRITVTDETGGSIRAGGNIGTFTSTGLNVAVVAAGKDFTLARIKDDVVFSTLAAGLDIGATGNLYNTQMVISDYGNLAKVIIGGDLIESNIVAGVAPGDDGIFGTADDKLQERAADKVYTPRIVDVSFPDFYNINITFETVSQTQFSNIGQIKITGEAMGSGSPNEQYAILAAGRINSVQVNRQAFSDTGNLVQKTVQSRDILSSSIVNNIDTLAAALSSAVIIQTDGVDHEFASLDLADIRNKIAAGLINNIHDINGIGDDTIIFGDGDPLTSPTMWIGFDADTNTAYFHKSDGFAINDWGTNYYKITVDASKIVNQQGVQLDGEFTGQWPSGDGTPGGNFEYYFAVGDLGDSPRAAFTPYIDSFPINQIWEYEGIWGDNMQYIADEYIRDQDLIRLDDLKEGQILGVNLEDLTRNVQDPYYWILQDYLSMQLYRVENNNLEMVNSSLVWEPAGRSDLEPPRDVVVPGLNELAFTNGSFYGYEDVGQTFYKFDRADLSVTMLANDLDDLNGLISDQGSISHLQALAGQEGDSLWAIADYMSNVGTTRQSLVLIKNISQDVDSQYAAMEPEVIISNIAIADNIIGLAQISVETSPNHFENILYGVNGTNNTLVKIASDPLMPTFGQVTLVGSLGIDGLNIVGLSANAQRDGLIAVHDQPEDNFDNFLVDSLYSININTGQASLLKELLATDTATGEPTPTKIYQMSGMAIDTSGRVVVGLPLEGSPIGDTVDITFDNQTMPQVFGESDVADFGGRVSVTSDKSIVLENNEQQEFIDGGFYYAFDIEYNQDLGDFSLTISDIDWLDRADMSDIVSVVADDSNVEVSLDWVTNPYDPAYAEQVINIIIHGANGDGDARIYFAGTSSLGPLDPVDLQTAGSLVGDQTRDDLSPIRDMILPYLEDMTIGSQVLLQVSTVELTDDLKEVLTDDLQENLQGDLTELSGLISQVLNQLGNNQTLIEEFMNAITTVSYDAVGYDAQMELFALIDTTSYDARPLIVADPNHPGQEVPLTMEVLNDIYQEIESDNIVLDNIRGLEFGFANEAESGTESYYLDELWAIVDVTDTDTGLSRESLLHIPDILHPQAGMDLSSFNLANPADGFTAVTELAFGVMPEADNNNGALYGYDAATQSLIKFDWQLLTPDLQPNISYGSAILVSSLSDAIGTPLDITGMAFDSTGRLLAVDNYRDMLMEIATQTDAAGLEKELMTLVQELPAADYQALTFEKPDPQLLDFLDFDNLFSPYGFIVRTVDGSPLADEMNVTVVDSLGANPEEIHEFGGGPTISGTVTISSSSSIDIDAEGGFYQFDVQYTTNQGDIQLTISDIDWLGGYGRVDSVAVSDDTNVTVVNFDDNTLTINIDTDNPFGEVTIYFGASSELLIPTSQQLSTTLVSVSTVDILDINNTMNNISSLLIQIPEDGDYILQIGNPFGVFDYLLLDYFYGYQISPTTYNLSVLLFDDGNSDFGTDATASGIIYDPVAPYDSPVNLTATTANDSDQDGIPDDLTLVKKIGDKSIYQYGPSAYPVTITGALLEPGIASRVVIAGELSNILDVDVYSFQLEEGQCITIDVEAQTLFGRDNASVTVGIYNGDFESITAILTDVDDTLSPSQQADQFYSAQAVFSLTKDNGTFEIDPVEYGVGTYYIVVSSDYFAPTGYDVLDQAVPYNITIETTAPEQMENPPSQLVWLAFDGARTDYLYEQYGWPRSVDNRPAFDAGDFDKAGSSYLASRRDGLIDAIAARIEQIYRDAGLTEDEIQFVTEKPAKGTVYSTVVFGGKLPETGIFGLAEDIDRHNNVHDDMAVVLTEEIARDYQGAWYGGPLDSDPAVRYDQVVTILANVGAHELGHILGLEHATEAFTNEPNNLMGYNDYLEGQALESRNEYWYQPIGYTNEIDMLLRNIGSGTPIGSAVA